MIAALPLLGSCAAPTPEPRLPQATAPVQTRQALEAAGLRPATIEGPRSGPAEGALPVGDLADSLGALLDTRSPGRPAVLIGNSLGGWVSLLYASRHPERVERVIGISSSGIFAILQVPVDLVWGEEDGVLPIDYGRPVRLAAAPRAAPPAAPLRPHAPDALPAGAVAPPPRPAGRNVQFFVRSRLPDETSLAVSRAGDP